MQFDAVVDLNEQGQPEIRMSWPMETLAKGTLRYDPPLEGIMILCEGNHTLRVPEFGIEASGRSQEAAEGKLQEFTAELLGRSRYNPPKLDRSELELIDRVKALNVRSNV